MVFKQLFNEIKTKLDTIPEINFMDWYLDQDKTKGGIPITPAVFIKFKPVNPKQLTKKSQNIEIEFELKIYTDFKKSTHKLVSDSGHFKLDDDVFSKLVKYEQIGVEPITKQDGFLYSSQTYVTKLVIALPLPPPANTVQSQNITLKINTT